MAPLLLIQKIINSKNIPRHNVFILSPNIGAVLLGIIIVVWGYFCFSVVCTLIITKLPFCPSM
jgi:hypothetical protein